MCGYLFCSDRISSTGSTLVTKRLPSSARDISWGDGKSRRLWSKRTFTLGNVEYPLGVSTLWNRLRYGSGRRPPGLAEMGKRLEQLQSEIYKVKADIDIISKELAGQPCEVKIERFFVDKVNLDRIIFNIDGLDVKDLSGSLSIGLNYGGRVIKLEKPEKTKNESQKKPEMPLKKYKRPEPTKKPEYEGQKDNCKRQSSSLGEQPDIRVSFTDLPGEGESIGRK